MSIELALREEILNVFGMIYDNINGRTYPQCIKKSFSKKRGKYLLDIKEARDKFNRRCKYNKL